MKFPEKYRIPNARRPFGSAAGDPFGFFVISRQDMTNGRISRPMKVIATDGGRTGWEHVSASLAFINGREDCPSWDEMCLIKGLFWEPEVCVVQFHPAESDYVNTHSGCLHLWRMQDGTFPMPPKACV